MQNWKISICGGPTSSQGEQPNFSKKKAVRLPSHASGHDMTSHWFLCIAEQLPGSTSQSEPTPLSPFGDMVAISEVFASSLDNFQPRHYSNVCCFSASGGKANIT